MKVPLETAAGQWKQAQTSQFDFWVTRSQDGIEVHEGKLFRTIVIFKNYFYKDSEILMYVLRAILCYWLEKSFTFSFPLKEIKTNCSTEPKSKLSMSKLSSLQNF